MSFKSCVDHFLNKYGDDAVVNMDGFDYNVKAVIYPMRYKNKMYVSMLRNDLGFNDNECFLYLGPAEPDFMGKEYRTTVSMGDMSFIVSRADRISLGKEPMYIWAVLTPRIKEGYYERLL